MRILLGHAASTAPFGFDNPQPSGDVIAYEGDAPLTIIAPTGSGKGRDVLIPMLLSSPTPAVVIDIKGEISAVCARRRQEMGHRVAVIDPFRITGKSGDRLNPFDIFGLEGSEIDCDSEMIAANLATGHEFRSDPYWTDAGGALIAGLVAYAASGLPDTPRSLGTVRKLLGQDDVDYSLAVILDTVGKKISPFAYGEIASYLQITADKTRPCVLSTARTFMRSLNSESVAACMEDPTIDLQDIKDGKPLDIFITVPPEKIISHAGFLRVMIGTVLTAIMRRKVVPEGGTMLIIDEAAQLGADFTPLITATTLLRGYGLKLVSIWQDMAQIKSRYAKDWSTILNNSGAVMMFGASHHSGARDAAEFLGLEPSEMLGLKPEEAMLAIRGEGTRKIRRMNYLTDAMFEGLADPNPFFGRRDGMRR